MSQRAQVEVMETKRLNQDYGVELEELIELVESYRNRLFDEDIKFIQEKYDNAEGLSMKLKTKIKDGLKWDDFEERDIEYGNNK
jgi:hypothetical protein